MATAGQSRGPAHPAGAGAAEDAPTEIAFRRSDWEHPGGRSRAEQAADHVAGLAGRRAPGTRLGTKEEVRALCGVSVGTFNEALRLLQTRHQITVRPGPGGGLFVTDQPPPARPGPGGFPLELDPGEAGVAEAVRLRDALEPLLIEDALWHASPADLAGLRGCLKPLADAAASQDARAFAQADWHLHAAIAAISPSPLLRSLYGALLTHIGRHAPSGAPARAGSLAESYQVQADLVAALERRDRSAATRLGGSHGEVRPGR